MMKKKPLLKTSQPIGLALLLLTAPSMVWSQSDTTDAEEEDIFELSPFQVDGSKDSGYRAANTLAGSRLNTSLKDVSSVVDVFTKEFMDDLGVTDLADVAVYSNNLIESTEDTRHGLGNLSVQASSGFNFRIRGLSATRARNYFDYNHASDSYNIERLDESRGPNAILFGFGSPGGIINASTKKAQVNKNSGSIKLSRGTEIKNRVEFDYNHVVLEDKLAVRLNALHHEEEGWRTYTFDDRDAYSVALTYKPFEKTTLSLEYENYEQKSEKARPLTFFNRAEKWQDAGAPLLAGGWGLRKNGTFNPDLDSDEHQYLKQLIGTNNSKGDAYWVLNEQSNSVANYRGMVRAEWPKEVGALPDGSTLTFFNGGRSVVTEPDGIFAVNVLGPGAFRDNKIENKFISIQQEITEDFHVELSATRNDVDWMVRSNFVSNLEGDPNLWLPSASATDNLPDRNNPVVNEYAGLPYFETNYQQTETPELYDAGRITASYELDLREKLNSEKMGNILGRHRFGFLYEENEYTRELDQQREMALIDGVLPRPGDANITDGRNRFYRRHYVTDLNNPLDYIVADWAPVNVTLDDGASLTTEFRTFQRRDDYVRSNDSHMFAMQNYWLDGRFVTTYGTRKDDVDFTFHGSKKTELGVVRDTESASFTSYSGDTSLIGGVYHFTPNFSVFYNDSESIGVPTLAIRYVPDGAFNDTTKGKGNDFGFRASFLDNRLYLSASAFEAAQTNETELESVQSWVSMRQDRIVDALVDHGLITAAEGDSYRVQGTGLTVDSETEGYEVNLTGRLTDNWNVRLNYSWTDREVNNVAPRIQKWANDTALPFWNSFDRVDPNDPDGLSYLDTVETNDGGSTLQDEIDGFQSRLNEVLRESDRVIGLRRNKANLFTTYRFNDGNLKGLTIGGGLRYVDKPVITQDLDGNNVYGSDNFSTDLNASYKTKIGQRNYRFQVNVRNAFRDEVEWSPINMIYDGHYESTVVFAPREFVFSIQTDF
ncbi:TonB-dependent siderophore receptor [Pelagicoccus mobilis]|uniref:TonB-dependent receptor plug domain-containing protein n=1 Tax=Pelagicoccus mobilis TaxID=415221 RepID=A0A934RWW3_9BACT|nr:TonB-dependent receptor plug domain-containing protein [Pelagicoccus mobilis]MBK1875877.1 hypothetical protein [Pelagicoccus mobilis]